VVPEPLGYGFRGSHLRPLEADVAAGIGILRAGELGRAEQREQHRRHEDEALSVAGD
jgi:hypothetical protein